MSIEYISLNLPDMVAEYIKNKILIEEIKPGAHILETQIADELGISRAPVREGLRQLQSQGLISFIPRRGNFVKTFTDEDIKEIFDIRLSLENDILKILIEEKKLTSYDYSELEKMINQMAEIAEETSKPYTERLININRMDINLHKYLWKASESERRVALLCDLYCQLQVAMIYDTKYTNNLLMTATDHFRILNGLKAYDLELTKDELRKHIISI